MTGGQALVQQLKREGIDTIFGLPGIQMDWMFDALHEESAHFKLYHPRHEQACVYMADGYARASGRIAVALMVPGPGLLNAAGALSTAYAVSSPVFVATGNIELKNIDKGKGLLHEIKDQRGMIAHVTKYQALARSSGEIPGLVREAMRQLTSGRPRPISIEVPPDIYETKTEVALIEPVPSERLGPDPELIVKAARLLGAAKRPLIFAGGGVIAGGACEALRQIAELLQAPVIQSVNGKDALSDRHPLSLPLRAMTEVGARHGCGAAGRHALRAGADEPGCAALGQRENDHPPRHRSLGHRQHLPDHRGHRFRRAPGPCGPCRGDHEAQHQARFAPGGDVGPEALSCQRCPRRCSSRAFGARCSRFSCASTRSRKTCAAACWAGAGRDDRAPSPS